MTGQNDTGPSVLILASVIWFLAKFLRYAFPPLFSQFQVLYGVSNSILGGAFTAMMLVYALQQFPAGVVADRLGSARVVTFGVIITGLASLTLSIPVPLAILIGGMILMGIGTGVHKTVAVDLLSTLYPERRGRALGLHDTFGAFGGVVAPAVVVAVMNEPGWRTLFLGSGVFAIVVAGVFWMRTPEEVSTGQAPIDDQPSFSDYRGLLGDHRFNAFLFVTVGFSFAYNGLTAFLPLYLTDAAGLNTATASLLYGALFAVSLVQLITGELSDRFSLLTVVVGTLALATIGFFGLLVGESPIVLGAAVVAIGLGSHGFRPIRGIHLIDLIPDSLAGGGLGVARTILMGAGAVSPAVVGYVSEYADFRAAFGLLLVAITAATLIAVWLFITKPDKNHKA